MPEKRGLENGNSGGDAKRTRFGDNGTGVAEKASVNTSTIEKAKRLLQLADKLKSKLKTLPSKRDGAAKTGDAGGARSALPSQASIYRAAQQTASQLEAAARADNPSIALRFFTGPTLPHSSTDPLSGFKSETAAKSEESIKFFDPHVSRKTGQRQARRNFWFVDDGRFEKEAELERIRAKYGDEVAFKIQMGRFRGLRKVDREDIRRYLEAGKKLEVKEEEAAEKGEEDEEMEVESEEEKEEVPEEIPDVEWWDKVVLANGSYEKDVLEDAVALKNSRITIYVEHPIPIEPPAEAPPPPPQPLKLTKKEMRKLRTQRRQQREKEKQELIRQGLLEPPKPKVKISNMMRVLAEEAALDPTAVEKEVRKEMEERQQAHEDRNLARKLTPVERKEKKLKKMFDESDVDKQVCVFKVLDLSNPKMKFKVTVNAQENQMTGACLTTDQFSIIVVEGCQKSVRRYKKLMLRRIKWIEQHEQDDDMDVDNTEGKKSAVPNACFLVWEGTVKKSHFSEFVVEEMSSEKRGRRFFENHGVVHYWDLAKAFDPAVSGGVEGKL